MIRCRVSQRNDLGYEMEADSWNPGLRSLEVSKEHHLEQGRGRLSLGLVGEGVVGAYIMISESGFWTRY